jgi:DNA-binding NtrC family response regulator
MAATMIQPAVRQRAGMLIASADGQFRSRWLQASAGSAQNSHEAEGGAHALAKLIEFDCDRVILDNRLPDLDAREVADMIRQRYPRTRIEIVDSRVSSEEPIAAISEEGLCSDVPGGVENIGRISDEIAEGTNREADSDALPGMIGESPAMREMYRMIRMVAPRDTAVLLTGETGTGKELAAQAVHQLSSRAKHPFVAVNCAAIPEALLESELFGHVRGAFTGAVQSRLGRIHMAHGGTLFLDEIGELPLGMQAKLLRFLQDGEVQRLGSADVYRMDVRVVCATNVRLLERIQSKQFRQDLYYRLAVFPVTLPPLRNRMDDLEMLAVHFLEKLSDEAEVALCTLSREALKTLLARRWEGNVRELQHALERAFILAGGNAVLAAAHCQQLSDMTDEGC